MFPSPSLRVELVRMEQNSHLSSKEFIPETNA